MELCPNSGLRKKYHGTSIIPTYYQFSSTKVDAQSDKLTTVVGRTKAQTLSIFVDLLHNNLANWSNAVWAQVDDTYDGQRSTDDIGQFITLNQLKINFKWQRSISRSFCYDCTSCIRNCSAPIFVYICCQLLASNQLTCIGLHSNFVIFDHSQFYTTS